MATIKELLDVELVDMFNKYQAARLETEKLQILQGAANVLTLLTQIAQYEGLSLNNQLMLKQLNEDVKPTKKGK